MSCRISRLIKRTGLAGKPKVIPLSPADAKDLALLRARREERRLRDDAARAQRPEGSPA